MIKGANMLPGRATSVAKVIGYTPDITVNRALARLYEKVGKFTQAIAVWELVRQADPSDMEASRKPRDLAAADTIARGQYEAEAERRQRPEAD